MESALWIKTFSLAKLLTIGFFIFALVALFLNMACGNSMVTILKEHFVLIPAGNYQVVCDDREKECPLASTDGFFISKYEVTFNQWDACVADGGCSHRPDDMGWGRGERPVINVSWLDIQEYLAWLNKKTGENYRLPMLDEYRIVTRKDGRFWKSKEDCSVSVFGRAGCNQIQTEPVGSRTKNYYGLYDLHGNVSEFTLHPSNGFNGLKHTAVGLNWDSTYHYGFLKEVHILDNSRFSAVGFRLAISIHYSIKGATDER